jgi:NADH-quinone oxidoreductase subunit D
MSQYREFLDTDYADWTIGPYHAALPGPMRVRMRLDGEVIVGAQAETGYLHRGLEKALERHTWQSAVMYADHLDPEHAVFGELAVCLAVEEIAEIEVPARARTIRILLAELARISSHLGYMARVARSVGGDTMLHYVLRDRERVIDLFELLTGARFSLNFLRYGGVSADVTEGFVERVLETCDLLRLRLKEYNDLFTFNGAFLRRSARIGIVTADQARAAGMTGPNARASGLALDVRKAHPYGGYDKIDFEVPVGRGEGGVVGDCHDRFVLRLREISQSIEILRQITEKIPPGEFLPLRVNRDFTVPPGEVYVRVESGRGLLGCYVMSDGGTHPARVQFRAPSHAGLQILPALVQGAGVEDLPMLLASLDLGVSEVDR